MNHNFSHHNPVDIHFGAGIYRQTLHQLPLSGKRVALFYGYGSMKNIGVIEAIKETLSGYEIAEYGGISPNPDVREVESVLLGFRGVDWVIAVGGGSVIDFAKSIAFIFQQKESLWTFLVNQNKEPVYPSLPLIAIPTTSGTGSEVTPWATVWDFENQKKYSLSHPGMFPIYAIVDPSLTLSLPPYETAYTVFDALSHALEALWSKRANPISNMYAIEAIRLIIVHLPLVIDEPAHLEFRAHLAKASLFAGLAFSNTQTAAVHAVSYPMTLHYGIPHGVACALTLPEFWKWNRSWLCDRVYGRVLEATGDDSEIRSYRHLKDLRDICNLPSTLKEAGIPEEGVDIIIHEALESERIVNNLLPITPTILKGLLEGIYE